MASRPSRTRSKTKAPEVNHQAQAPAVVSAKQMVLFVHGIRDPGFWEDKLKELFERNDFIAKPIGYGVFDAFRFLFGFRRRAVDMVKRQIVDAIKDNNGSKLTIIAHSFGTYIVSRILEDDPNIKLARLVMCGGIVNKNFRWDKVARFNGQMNDIKVEIINEHSARDIWPIMARHATYGVGDSGAIGCADKNAVLNRRHNIPHSAYLDLTFAKEFWVPSFAHGEEMKYPRVENKLPWFFFLTRIPFRIVTMSFVLATFGVGYWLWDVNSFKTQGTFRLTGDVGAAVKIDGYTDLNKSHRVQFYSAQDENEPTTHRFESEDLLQVIDVTISNRYPFRCKNRTIEGNEGPSLGERNKASNTVFEFDLSNSYRFFGIANLDFTYIGAITTKDSPEGLDLLTIGANGKLIADKITTKYVHHSGDCLPVKDEQEEDLYVKKKVAMGSPDRMNLNFFPVAWGGVEVLSLESANVRKLLEEGDDEQRAVAIDAIVANPAKYKLVTRDFVDSSPTNQAALADAIRAARKTRAESTPTDPSKTINLTSNTLIRLAYEGSPQVRDAARSYLRAPGVVSDELANQLIEKISEESLKKLKMQKVPGRDYYPDYLLLITARDVFYNLGLKKLEPYLDKIRKGELTELTKPIELAKVLKPFDDGIALRSLARTVDESIALSKNSYGKALVLFESAVNTQAFEETIKTEQSVSQVIEDAKKKGKPLADKVANGGTSIKDQFTAFLTEIGNKGDLYPWPFHIEQANRCKKSLTFACLDFANEISE